LDGEKTYTLKNYTSHTHLSIHNRSPESRAHSDTSAAVFVSRYRSFAHLFERKRCTSTNYAHIYARVTRKRYVAPIVIALKIKVGHGKAKDVTRKIHTRLNKCRVLRIKINVRARLTVDLYNANVTIKFSVNDKSHRGRELQFLNFKRNFHTFRAFRSFGIIRFVNR